MPQQTHTIPATIEGEIITNIASAQIIRLDWQKNTELVIEPFDHFQIDLCLSARLQGMSVCYPDRWGAARFERVGELLIIPPGERVIARCDFPDGAGENTHASTVVKFDADLVYQWSGGHLDWSSEQLLAALDISDQSIYSLMGRLTREGLNVSQSGPADSAQVLVELIARQLGIEVSRYAEGHSDFEFKGGLAAWRLRLIDERAQQVDKPPSIAELAALCNLSARQLQRGFRVSRGCSLGRHIEHCRMENAKRLLQQGVSIADVATKLGFSSSSSFTYAFRRSTGGTPSQFCQLV